MPVSFKVENIKCGGCANQIRQKLLEFSEVQAVEVDIENALVTCEVASDGADISAKLADKLLQMGYPQQGSVTGLQAAGAKAKSFVSCAVGRMSDD